MVSVSNGAKSRSHPAANRQRFKVSLYLLDHRAIADLEKKKKTSAKVGL
jgi:hypothetical protein